MENKNILIYGTILTIVGAGAYFYFQNKKKTSSTKEDDTNKLLEQALGINLNPNEATTPKLPSQVSSPTTVTTTTSATGQTTTSTSTAVTLTPEVKKTMADAVVSKYTSMAYSDAKKNCGCPYTGTGLSSVPDTYNTSCDAYWGCVNRNITTNVASVNAEVLPLGYIAKQRWNDSNTRSDIVINPITS